MTAQARRSHFAGGFSHCRIGNAMQDKSAIVTKGSSFFANQAVFSSSYFHLTIVEELSW